MGLIDHSDLGSYPLIRDFLTKILPDEEYHQLGDLRHIALNRSRRYASSWAGLLELLAKINVVRIQGKSIKLLTDSFDPREHLETKEDLCKVVLIPLFEYIIDEYPANPFTDSLLLSFNTIQGTVCLGLGHIPIKFLALKNLLVDIGFYTENNKTRSLMVDGRYLSTFENDILSRFRRKLSVRSITRSMGLQNLMELQTRLMEIGGEAEEWVLEYEKRRLDAHPGLDRVRIISEIDVNAGYDIISYNNIDSDRIDRFIEVKSYSSSIGFYWSNNEIKSAKIKRDNYYLFLVDRDKMNQSDYVPVILNDPFETIFCSEEWLKEPRNWFCTRNN